MLLKVDVEGQHGHDGRSDKHSQMPWSTEPATSSPLTTTGGMSFTVIMGSESWMHIQELVE